MEEWVLVKFNMPQQEPYNSTTDPLDHLENYKALMLIQGTLDDLLCMACLATFIKAT